MSIIDVKPEALSEFGVLQAEVMAAQRAGGQPWRETWNTATLGYPYRVAVLSPVDSLDQLDGQTFTAKGVGPAAATAINDRARRMIANQQIYLMQVRPDLGIGVRTAGKNTLAVVSYISVAPGREPEVEQMMKSEVYGSAQEGRRELLRRLTRHLWWRHQPIHDAADVRQLCRPRSGHPLERALGADGLAKLQAKLTGIITKLERHVIRFNEALSFRPATKTP